MHSGRLPGRGFCCESASSGQEWSLPVGTAAFPVADRNRNRLRSVGYRGFDDRIERDAFIQQLVLLGGRDAQLAENQRQAFWRGGHDNASRQYQAVWS